jgi:hypothetical protein
MRATKHSTIKSPPFNPSVAGRAMVDGLIYLQHQLHWSGTKIATLLHLPANTLNIWIKNGAVPIGGMRLNPEIQAIIHLLAIHRSLEAIFSDPIHQQAWLSTFHPELNIIPEKLIGESIDGLIYIRQYLDYIRSRGA